MYRLRALASNGVAAMRPEIEFEPLAHAYKVNGETGWPSVTQIIGATVAKPFGIAANWGYKIGLEAGWYAYSEGIEGGEEFPDFDAFNEFARDFKTPNSVRDKAGTRGTAIHEALERYAKTGEVPNPSDFKTADQKRIKGVAAWLIENRPTFYGSEIRTASLAHRYVGSLDAFLLFEDGEFKGKTCRLDYKTGKNLYPAEQFPQLEAYEEAEKECGEPESDLRVLLHIPESGRCKMKVSTDSFKDFEVLLNVWRSTQQRKERGRK